MNDDRAVGSGAAFPPDFELAATLLLIVGPEDDRRVVLTERAATCRCTRETCLCRVGERTTANPAGRLPSGRLARSWGSTPRRRRAGPSRLLSRPAAAIASPRTPVGSTSSRISYPIATKSLESYCRRLRPSPISIVTPRSAVLAARTARPCGLTGPTACIFGATTRMLLTFANAGTLASSDRCLEIRPRRQTPRRPIPRWCRRNPRRCRRRCRRCHRYGSAAYHSSANRRTGASQTSVVSPNGEKQTTETEFRPFANCNP